MSENTHYQYTKEQLALEINNLYKQDGLNSDTASQLFIEYTLNGGIEPTDAFEVIYLTATALFEAAEQDDQELEEVIRVYKDAFEKSDEIRRSAKAISVELQRLHNAASDEPAKSVLGKAWAFTKPILLYGVALVACTSAAYVAGKHVGSRCNKSV